MKEEPNHESKGRKVTHRLGCEFSGKDGVKRRLEMYHLEDGAVGFIFTTWWDGEDKPALETPISMTMESFNVLQAMIADYSAHREHYAIN